MQLRPKTSRQPQTNGPTTIDHSHRVHNSRGPLSLAVILPLRALNFLPLHLFSFLIFFFLPQRLSEDTKSVPPVLFLPFSVVLPSRTVYLFSFPFPSLS